MSQTQIRPSMTPAPKRKKLKVVMLSFLILILLVLIGVIGVNLYMNQSLEPVKPGSNKMILVEIPAGSNASQISQTLENKDLIKSARMFNYYVKKHQITDLKAGTYELSKGMSVEQIVKKIQSGKIANTKIKIVVPEGKRLVQIADLLAQKTSISKDEWLQTMNDRTFIQQLMQKYPETLTADILNPAIKYPLEGYLFPATYEFERKDLDKQKVIEKMVQTTSLVFKRYEAQFQQAPYNRHQIMALASVIERESKKPEDRVKVSGVFYNRLKQNMPLQSDVTVLYALNDHRIQVTYKDLEVDSPYNTYKYAGLPVGPIDSPGEESIKAALMPEVSDNLFFYARPNGEVIYSKTFAEHEQVVNQYKSEWAALK